MKGERTSKQQNYYYFITKPNYFITIFLHHDLLWEAKLKILARKRKKVDRVITTQPTLTTNIISVNLYDKT